MYIESNGRKSRLAIVTPIFPPATGGAATYYQVLARMLHESGAFDRIDIVTEFVGERKVPSFIGRLVSLFPTRASFEGDQNAFIFYFKYLIQNFAYFLLPCYALRHRWRVVLIHTSFHNYPGLFWLAVWLLKAANVKLVADCRDHQLPAWRARQLSIYSSIITASENIYRHLTTNAPHLDARIMRIPVIQEGELAKDDTGGDDHFPAAFDTPYVVCVGLVKPLKGVDVAVNAFLVWKQKYNSPHTLLVIGHVKDYTYAETLQMSPAVFCLGALSRQQVLGYVSQADLVLNCSRSEGLPRSCLETLALQRRCLLPAGVPEFSKYLPEWVARSSDVYELADQIEEIREGENLCYRYPLEMHAPENVLHKYMTVL